MIELTIPIENAPAFGVEGEMADIVKFISATHPQSNKVDIENTLLELISREPIRVVFHPVG
jgi:hypothetical protein